MHINSKPKDPITVCLYLLIKKSAIAKYITKGGPEWTFCPGAPKGLATGLCKILNL